MLYLLLTVHHYQHTHSTTSPHFRLQYIISPASYTNLGRWGWKRENTPDFFLFYLTGSVLSGLGANDTSWNPELYMDSDIPTTLCLFTHTELFDVKS